MPASIRVMIFARKGNILAAYLYSLKALSLLRFLKPVVLEDSHLELVRKARANMNNKQLFSLKVE